MLYNVLRGDSMKSFSNILWGIVLVLLGLVFGLNAIGVTDINLFFDGWWTLIIIIPCFINLFHDDEKIGSLIGVCIGVFLLLGCQGIIDFSLIWKLIVPIVLVVIGLSMLFKNSVKDKIKKEIGSINKKSNNKEYSACFSGTDLDFSNEEFRGCDLNASFGGIKCDLRKSKIKKDAVINAFSVFGGITIFVPDDVNVKIVSSSIFGGVSGKGRDVSSDAKTVYINASCLFGGVEIK